MLLHIPVVGRMIRMWRGAAGCRELTPLLRHGVPLMDALRCVREAESNTEIAVWWGRVAGPVRCGEPLFRSLRRHLKLEPWLVYVVETGEETARLPEALDRVAAGCQDEFNVVTERLYAVTDVFHTLLSGPGVGFFVLVTLPSPP
ncbi:MAG: type II secretion system F family protein [Planctomycetes bacterium]|nr:type II secretion system F family protein [Planctomycetota bacterium]